MPPIPASTRHAPCPAGQVAYPWRFRLGQHVYVLSRHPDDTFTIVGGELWMGCPHLHVTDINGKTWRVPQLHCSSKPISPFKG